MDKRVIFAVAGSGKTARIIEKLELNKRSLIITYTENNYKNLKIRIIRKFGFFPENIKLYTYFTFLYSFCYKPFLSRTLKAKGISWEIPSRYLKKDIGSLAPNYSYFMDRNRKLYSNRIAKLLEQMQIQKEVIDRLEKYVDNLFIDEIQDFGGHDFNLLKFITKSNINITFVGDFYQHTFDTSKDGNTNKNIHKEYEKYKLLFQKMGLIVDTESLKKSYRCSPDTCNFVSTKLDIYIESDKDDKTNILYVDDEEEADRIFRDNNIVKLFYQNSTKYSCYSNNWGKSKGEDHYEDVCIVLNPTTLGKYTKDKLLELNPQTKNKLYVACTRTRGNLYFISEKMYKKFKI